VGTGARRKDRPLRAGGLGWAIQRKTTRQHAAPSVGFLHHAIGNVIGTLLETVQLAAPSRLLTQEGRGNLPRRRNPPTRAHFGLITAVTCLDALACRGWHAEGEGEGHRERQRPLIKPRSGHRAPGGLCIIVAGTGAYYGMRLRRSVPRLLTISY
jgi:hypothetical protein